jgi:hypothetical protein
VRISRNYKVDDWKRLRFESQDDWQRGVTIFQDRLETRYLEHVRALLGRKTSGFVVLALDSALVETLEQFRRGKRKTPKGKGKEYFRSFLTETAFGQYFDPELADLFYPHIRCGLLHQTEAEGASRIKRGRELSLASYTVDHSGIIINTRSFHNLLEQVIHNYVDELRRPESIERREAFRKKMNYICRIEEQAPESESVLK